MQGDAVAVDPGVRRPAGFGDQRPLTRLQCERVDALLTDGPLPADLDGTASTSDVGAAVADGIASFTLTS